MYWGGNLARYGGADDQAHLEQLQIPTAHAIHQSIGRNVFGAAFERFLNERFSREALRHGGGEDRIDRRQRGGRHATSESRRPVARLRAERSRRHGDREREDQPQTHGWALTGRTMTSEFCCPAPNPSST